MWMGSSKPNMGTALSEGTTVRSLAVEREQKTWNGVCVCSHSLSLSFSSLHLDTNEAEIGV
jgi:hypothetical protein